jgi:transitional endoplasmic reticulum ATPase
VQTLFATAHRNAPALILIDDIELLCANRADTTGALGDLRKRIVSCLLTLIEGVSSGNSGVSGSGATDAVFILATSSNPRDIDPAMRRPGRLDREIALEVPSAADRALILRSTLRAMNIPIYTEDTVSPHSVGNEAEQNAGASAISSQGAVGSGTGSGVTSSCVEEVARGAHGMVGSDLLLVCKEACLLAVERITNARAIAGASVGVGVGVGVGVSGSSSGVGDGSRVRPIVLADDLDFGSLSLKEVVVDTLSASTPHSESSQAAAIAAAATAEGHQQEAKDMAHHAVQSRDLLLGSTCVKPSAVREVAVEVPQVKWTDIGGMDGVKQSLREVGSVTRTCDVPV